LTRLTESGDTVETRANQIASHFMLAAVARSTSSWAKAATNLRTALELDPTNQETLKAFVDLHVGVVESAPIIAAYRVFLRAHPEHNEVRLALARSLILASRGQEAVIELQRVVDRAPDHMDALGEHAHLLTHMGRFVEVHRGLQAAAQRHQLDADRTQEIGRIYLNLHKFQDALALFNHALAINPRHARAAAGRGACFDGMLDPGPAVRAYMEAIDLTPNDRWVALRLSALLAQRGAFDASQLVISNFLAYSPSDPVALVRDALLTPVMLDDVAMIDAARKRYGDKFDALATHSEQIALKELAQIPASFDLAYHGRNDRELLGKMTSAMLRLCPALNFRAPHTEKKRQTKRLRVGIISNFLRLHTIGRLYRGIIEHFDRRKFELIVIRPFTAKEDEWSRAIDACAATTVSLPRSLEAAQHLLASLELDTLLFTDIGMDEHCFLLAFGRYARVQAVSWGHPDTTGIPTIDYFISSARIETADADTHYSERLVRLPNLPSHYNRPMAGNPFNRAQFGLPSDMRLYGCPQSLFKFHPEFDPLLAGILRTDPKALIVVPASMPTWRELLRHRLKATMPDVLDRVRFTPTIPSDQFLGFLGSMDVLLDPIHFGGGNTTYESMSMGAPVVTWPKEFMRARVTAGAYDQMGFNELVVNDATSYVERAVRVANDDSYRRYCVQAIQDGSNQVIENMSAVRELEAFFAWAYAES
ncbi:MAG: tetratricopeptide repeat protein, partial [Burkholderiales bacterium]